MIQLTTQGHLHYRDATGHVQKVSHGHLLLFTLDEPTAYYLHEPRSFTYHCTWCHLSGAGLHAHIAAYRKRHGSIVDLRSSSLRQLFDQLIHFADSGVGHNPFEV